LIWSTLAAMLMATFATGGDDAVLDLERAAARRL
jgi:hypothetical protein